MNTYTPIFESIISLDNIKLADAATFGIIWRYCQMKKGFCNAAPGTMAEKIGVSTKTVRRSFVVLQGLNLIEDLTPGRRNDTHEYILTDYAKRLISSELVGQNVQPEVRQNDQPKDDRLDKMTNPVGQNDQARLVKMSNEESLLRDSIRESDALDPLGHIVQASQEGVAPEPEVYVRDQFCGYRDEYLQIFGEYFPSVNLTKDQTTKGVIADLGYEQSADPAKFAQACRETILNWSGNGKPPIQRIIDVYQIGEGSYETWRKTTYGQNGIPPPKTKKVYKTESGEIING